MSVVTAYLVVVLTETTDQATTLMETLVDGSPNLVRFPHGIAYLPERQAPMPEAGS